MFIFPLLTLSCPCALLNALLFLSPVGSKPSSSRPTKISQSLAWEDTKLGWIENPQRPSGKYYSSILPTFYESYWPFYPHKKAFRSAFVIERSRQWDLTVKLNNISEKLVSFGNEKNDASASRYIGESYVPQQHDSNHITDLIKYLSTLRDRLCELDALIKSHHESLLVKSTKKLMSGRQCHHLFNEKICQPR